MPKGIPLNGLRKPKKWKDEFYVTVYQLAMEGKKNKEIAGTLGVSENTFNKWLEKRPALTAALGQARGSKKVGGETFADYVFKRLSPKAQRTWDKMREWEKETNGIQKIEQLLSNAGVRIRQHLFLHALIYSSFNLSEACRRVNITRTLFEDWCLNDPNFTKLADEIQWHKKNFFESCLVRLAKQGDTNAILFANKSLNKDRGYNDRVEIEHNVKHSGMIGHAVVRTKDLPLEARKAMLEQIRKRKALEEKAIKVKVLEAHKED